MTAAPTERQRDVMVAIAAAWSREGMPATLRELAVDLGITYMAVFYNVDWLRKKRLLTVPTFRGRTLLPSDEGWRALGVEPPVVAARCRPLLMRCKGCGRSVVHDALAAKMGPPFFVYWSARLHEGCSRGRSRLNFKREGNMDDKFDIAGLDAAEILRRLYNEARPLGFGHLQAKRELMSHEEAATVLRKDREGDRVCIDYLHGRPLKVWFIYDGDKAIRLEGAALYDRDQGAGRCRRIIEAIRASTPA